MRAECIAIASIMPRGVLLLVKVEFSCFDRRGTSGRITDDLNLAAESVAWAVLHEDEPLQINSTLGPSVSTPQPHIAGAPLHDAVFDGYPGVLLAYRGPEDRPFTAEELNRLRDSAAEFSKGFRDLRAGRVKDDEAIAPAELPVDQRFIALTSELRPWFMPEAFSEMDPMLRSNLLQAIAPLVRATGDANIGADVTIEDSLGRLRRVYIVTRSLQHVKQNGQQGVNGRASRSKSKSAAEGPRVLCCFTPPLIDWRRLRPEDLMAHPEMMRLVPAIEFMTGEFMIGDIIHQPALSAIAQSVNLSPFHFHRRFTELFGITPKQLLLIVQIAHVRRLLGQPDQSLAEISRICGFAHQSHLTSRFKQATGLTPTRWRRLIDPTVKA